MDRAAFVIFVIVFFMIVYLAWPKKRNERSPRASRSSRWGARCCANSESLCIHCNKCMPTIYVGTHCVLVDPSERPGRKNTT